MASNKRSRDDDKTASRKSAKKQQDKGSSSSSAAAADTNPNNGRVFTCDICQKTFSQGRALGGHKSSHNKYKCIIINTIEEDMKKNARSNPKNNRPEIKVDDHQQVKDDDNEQIKDDDHQQIIKDDGHEQINNEDDDDHGDYTRASVESSTSEESYGTEDLDDSDSDDDDDDDHRFHECMQCGMIFEAKKLLDEHNKKNHGEDHHLENTSSYIDLNKPCEDEDS